MPKLTIQLRPSERKALRESAWQERRRIDEQAAHLVRLELQRRGLLPSDGPVSEANMEPASATA